MSKRIGFIGLGVMGAPMARNIVTDLLASPFMMLILLKCRLPYLWETK